MDQNRQTSSMRWQTPDGSRLAREVFERLIAGVPLSDLQLGEHEGRIDLRGLRAPEVIKEKLPPFRNWSLQKLKGASEFTKCSLGWYGFK